MQLVKAAQKHLSVARGVQIWFTFLTHARLVCCLLLDSACVLLRLVSLGLLQCPRRQVLTLEVSVAREALCNGPL